MKSDSTCLLPMISLGIGNAGEGRQHMDPQQNRLQLSTNILPGEYETRRASTLDRSEGSI